MKIILQRLVLFLGCLSLVACRMDALNQPNINQTAPDFTLNTTRAEQVNMTSYRAGKKGIIFFWATWCPHCREAIKDLNAGMNDLKAKGIAIILVDLGESKEQVESYLKKADVTLEVFLDTEESLASPYGIMGVPTLYFVNEEGAVKSMQHGIPKNLDEAFK
jgi:cytochrome c biogenesis protein CcmG/thiol:disulfide interchange protein DsbE